VRVRGDESDRRRRGRLLCPAHWEESRAFYGRGVNFEILNGVSEIPPEFQLEIQLDMRVVADFTGSLATHGDGVSYTSGITGTTLLAEKPIQEEEEAAAATTLSVSSASSPSSVRLPPLLTKYLFTRIPKR